MRDDHLMYDMNANLLLDITLSRYYVRAHFSAIDTAAHSVWTHPPKTLNSTLFSYTNWSGAIAEYLEA